MAKQFNVGDTVYFISSSVFVRKATVIRAAAGFVTIKFDTNNVMMDLLAYEYVNRRCIIQKKKRMRLSRSIKVDSKTVESYN